MTFSCFKKVGMFFKAIDQFGIKTELKFESKVKFTTNIGGVFTMIYISIFIVLFISSGTDMMNHANPSSSFTKEFSPVPEPINFSKDNFFFVFGLQNNQSLHFYDDSIYTVVFQHYEYNSSVPFIPVITDIPFERCTSDNLPTDINLKYDFLQVSNNISDLLCIKKDFDGKIRIKGTWINLNYEYISININRCVNSSDPTKPICKSNVEISSVLNEGYFAFYASDTIIDTQNFKEPGKKNLFDYYTPTNLRIKKNLVRYLSNTYLISDNGWIAQTLQTSEYATYDSDRENFDIKADPNSNDYIMSMTLRKSTYNYIFNRSYKKVQTVLAEMGGFLKISFIVFNFLACIFANHIYFNEISNILYTFQRTDRENERSLSKEIEINKTIARNKSENIKLSFQNSEEQILPIDDEKLIRYFEKLKQKPLGMSFCEHFKGFFSKDPFLLTKKFQRKKAIESIFSRLDLKYILKKFLEIDKLKFLLLDNDQLKIFDNLPKPMISKRAKMNINPMDMTRMKSLHRMSNMTVDPEKILSKISIFKNCFLNIMKKNELDDIDKRLISFIGEDLKNILGINEFLKLKKSLIDKNGSLKDIKIETNEFSGKTSNNFSIKTLEN